MRVGLIGGLAGPGSISGGVWRALETQARALQEDGHKVKILTGYAGKVPRNFENHTQAALRVFPPFPRAGLKGLWSPRLTGAVKRLARWADIVHVHVCRDLFTMPSVYLLAASDIPMIGQPHGMLRTSSGLVYRAYDRVLTRSLLCTFNIMLHISAQERQDLRELGVQEDRLRAIDNATPRSELKWKDPARPTFLFASRLHRRKQPRVFVEAALRFLADGCDGKFIIAGSDEGEEAQVRDTIERSSYRNHFDLIGDTPHSDLMHLLSECTAAVLPSIEEPYGLIVIEALSIGVPAIVTRQTGIRHLLENRRAAELVAPDVPEVYGAMRLLAANREHRTAMSVRGLDLYEHTWSPKILAGNLSTFYNQAINAERSVRRSTGRSRGQWRTTSS